MKIVITQINHLPPMDSGATEPGIMANEEKLFVVYRKANGNSYTAIQFNGLISYNFGYPNDEALAQHRYYKFGLKHYSFNQIDGSPEAERYPELNPILWVITFHDQTFEVLARNIQVCTEEVQADSAAGALKSIAKNF